MDFTNLLKEYNLEYDIVYNFIKFNSDQKIFSQIDYFSRKLQNMMSISTRIYTIKRENNISCVSFIRDYSMRNKNIMNKLYKIYMYITQKNTFEKFQSYLNNMPAEFQIDKDLLEWKENGQNIIARKFNLLKEKGLFYIPKVDYSKLNELEKLSFFYLEIEFFHQQNKTFLINQNTTSTQPIQNFNSQNIPIQFQQPFIPFWAQSVVEPPIYTAEDLQRLGLVPLFIQQPFQFLNPVIQNAEDIVEENAVDLVSESIEKNKEKKKNESIVLKMKKSLIEKSKRDENSKCIHGNDDKCSRCEKNKCVHGTFFYHCTKCRAFCNTHSPKKIKKFNCKECQNDFKNIANKQKNFFEFLNKINDSSSTSE